ncbi:MAG: hypothetical protein B7Y51_02765 [Burkholderiales bacterium 28-67-8]|nr:MAG: hypothetical protein B7Y51_02765 [Burkholderiales bacterium 28-67-8]
MTVAPLARTNVQLLNQLIDSGMPEPELLQVRRACDLAGDLYSSHFHADGKPFVCHSMAVASMAARLGLRPNVIVAAVVHNVYCNADFGDGLRDSVTPSRRARLRERLGTDVEAIVLRFRDRRLRTMLRPIDAAQISTLDIGDMSALDRELVLLDLADHFEKFVDGSLAYYGDCSWILEFDEPRLAQLADLAATLGQAEFGAQFVAAARQQRVWMERVPVSLRTAGAQRHVQMRMPGNCERKAALRRAEWCRRQRDRWVGTTRWLRHRVRLRTRLRQWLASARG